MRYRMHTLSGAVYVIDEEAMTWERKRPEESQIGIIGLARDSGNLAPQKQLLPQPRLNQRCRIEIEYPEDPEKGDNYITTTAVQRLELL